MTGAQAGRAAGLGLALVTGVMASPVFADRYDEAAGRVMAASLIAESCDGLRGLGTGDSQSFVIAASDLLAGQGLRSNKMRRILFYAQTDSLIALGRTALSNRGVDLADRAALCRFGMALAETNDAVGQFLVKGD